MLKGKPCDVKVTQIAAQNSARLLVVVTGTRLTSDSDWEYAWVPVGGAIIGEILALCCIKPLPPSLPSVSKRLRAAL
jgi:hypothetical protein